MAVTHLGNGLRCMKYLLIAGNSLFMLTGLMLISVGYLVHVVHDYNMVQFFDSEYLSLASIIFVLGGLTLVITSFGCLGAIRESTAMLRVFTVSLSTIIVTEIPAIATAFAFRREIFWEVKDSVYSRILHAMSQYRYNSEARKAVDSLRSFFGCCQSPSGWDWFRVHFEKRTGLNFDETYTNWACGEEAYERCIREWHPIIRAIIDYAGMVIFVIMLMQILGIIFAWSLGKAIKEQKTKRDMCRWESQKRLLNDDQPIEQKIINSGQIPQYIMEQPFEDVQSSKYYSKY